nr:ectonucleotide pyrophosphatase:phosphodiesterase [Hymenolepis microstoma]
MRSILALLALFFGTCIGSKVILISFDGFRHDYIEMAKAQKRNVSAFEYLESQGFRGMEVLSVMPSLTFPSHFALATGRYTENHGLVGNTFYDSKLKDNYTYKNSEKQLESKWFSYNNNEPIWLSVKRHGGKCGVMYWTGSDARIDDSMAYVNYGLYSTVPNLRFRVDRAMDWITRPDVNCVLLYFNEPDSSGHSKGPNSEKVLSAIEKCNDGLAYLIQRINESNDFVEKPNIIVTSDHGMTTVNISVVVPIYNYLKLDEYNSGVDGSPATLGIWPLPYGPTVDELYTKVKKAETECGHCKVYKREEIPDEYHYKHNDRIAPIVVIAEEGWMIQTNESKPYTGDLAGMHGYNNSKSDMHPFIIAAGPGIRKLGRVDTFYQVDVYALVLLLLKYYMPAVVDSDVMRVATYVKNIPSLSVLQQFDRYAKGIDPLPDASSMLEANMFFVLVLLLAIQIILRH